MIEVITYITLTIRNMRIINNSGYEYRTNLLGIGLQAGSTNPPNNTVSFNYNIENGVILSDLYGFETWDAGSEEIKIADILNAWINLDVDIYDSNEVPFSCRNVIFACVDQDNPLLEALLELVNDGENANTGNGSGSVASFEYGINEAIPSSKDAPLLCPNNNISEGIVNFTLLDYLNDGLFMFFVGLNNGNGRGSFESYWHSQL